VGSGTFTLRFGTGSGAFTADTSRSQVDITLTSSDTLTTLAQKINAGAGVSAYVATGSGGAQLVIKGADGAANGFQIETTPADGDTTLSTFAWTPGRRRHPAQVHRHRCGLYARWRGAHVHLQHHHRCRAGLAQADRHQCRIAHHDRLFRSVQRDPDGDDDLVDALNQIVSTLTPTPMRPAARSTTTRAPARCARR
jgi:hypothetical protein